MIKAVVILAVVVCAVYSQSTVNTRPKVKANPQPPNVSFFCHLVGRSFCAFLCLATTEFPPNFSKNSFVMGEFLFITSAVGPSLT